MEKVKITIWVDQYLKDMFDASKSIHKKSYVYVLTRGMLDTIKDINPLQVLDREIEAKNQELEEIRQLRARMQIDLKHQKPHDAYTTGEKDDISWRDELFEKDFPVLKKTWGSNDFFTSRLMNRYDFKTKMEARTYFKPRMDKKLAAEGVR